MPYKIHAVLTDNGIEHHLTKVTQPQTNSQIERMKRMIKEAGVWRFHYDDHAPSKHTSQLSSQPTTLAEG